MNSIATSINKDLLFIVSKIDETLNTKLVWKNTNTGGDDLISIVTTITKEQEKVLDNDKIVYWCDTRFTGFNDRDYYLDYVKTKSDDGYKLYIHVSLNTENVVNSVVNAFPLEYGVDDVTTLRKEVVYRLKDVTKTIEKLVGRPLSWSHYYDHGDEVVGVVSLGFNDKELEQIYNFYTDESEETVVFENDNFLIGMWYQDDEDALWNICLNVRDKKDMTKNSQLLVRQDVISVFPIKHVDTPYSDKYLDSLKKEDNEETLVPVVDL